MWTFKSNEENANVMHSSFIEVRTVRASNHIADNVCIMNIYLCTAIQIKNL